jgi:Tfp pilus assembly protein PilO
MDETKTSIENVRAFKAKLTETTPTVDRIALVFAAISNYSKLAGTSMVRFDPQNPVKMASISQVPVNLTVEGSYQQVFDLLRRLDNAPNPIWEKEVTIQAVREKTNAVRCQVNLTIFADNRDNSN